MNKFITDLYYEIKKTCPSLSDEGIKIIIIILGITAINKSLEKLKEEMV